MNYAFLNKIISTMFEYLEKYNFWKQKDINFGYLREHYLHKILKYVDNKLVKVFIGQRRTGKSYLMRQVIMHLINRGVARKNIFYFSKEYLEFDSIKSWQDLHNLIKLYKERIKPKGKVYLFLDEIQQIDGWERLVNSYSQDFINESEVFITGSNSDLLSGELATHLSGRYVQFEVLPFSFTEYCGYINLERNRSSYLQYLQEGGLPETFYLPDFESKMHYIASLRDTILLRDIVDRYRIKDSVLLDDVFKFITNNTSNLISVPNVVNYLNSSGRKVNYETISSYLGYLQTAGLIHECERFNIKGKELLGGVRKYYLNDLSFYNFLYPGFRHGMGFMIENLVYLHFRKNGYSIYTGNISGKEVDFVIQKHDRTIYIQAAFTITNEETLTREIASLKAIPDNFEKWILSLDDIALKNNEGIIHKLVWELEE